MRKRKICCMALILSVILILAVAEAAEIPLVKVGGVYTLPVEINGVMKLDFILDTGASEVCIPADVASTLLRTRTISAEDFLPGSKYTLADGSVLDSPRFIIREMNIAGTKIRNVAASVMPAKGNLLLGQSLLERLGSWSFDPERSVLILGELKGLKVQHTEPAQLDSTFSAVISSPLQGETVERVHLIKGHLSNPNSTYQAFLVIQSTAGEFGRRIYPQGEITADPNGFWTVRGIYGSPNYEYRTYVILTSNPESAQILSEKQNKEKGLGQLPPDTQIIGQSVLVHRK